MAQQNEQGNTKEGLENGAKGQSIEKVSLSVDVLGEREHGRLCMQQSARGETPVSLPSINSLLYSPSSKGLSDVVRQAKIQRLDVRDPPPWTGYRPRRPASSSGDTTAASIMAPPSSNLAAPKDDRITPSQLAANDGRTPETPIWLAIKGTVFDVTPKRAMYGPGAGYHVFAGKDGSVGLGKSSLKPEDAIPDYTTLEPAEMKVLDQWYDFFSKRYNVVGKVVAE
ncbi:hypothetical protein QFC19_004549 [Naganishia cerealis]|uniref:Uncharacterized protein n=1 Tax=Naganishia cerealis TaxID=610337 RepID=A0ACC2VX42_9TREE|nr:hypothetical protein QFC19_004549 [Naganishia cerealis]